jgi:hypothetical protein
VRDGRRAELPFGVAPQPQRGVQAGELRRVAAGELVGEAGLGPAGLGVDLDLQAEFAGQGSEAAVVPAALAAGVLDAAGVGQAMGGLVQQGGQHRPGAALEALTGDQHLGTVGVGHLPARGGEVPPLEQATAGLAASPQDDHHLGHVGMVSADRGPCALQRGDHGAGGCLRAWRGGLSVHGRPPLWGGRGRAGGGRGWPPGSGRMRRGRAPVGQRGGWRSSAGR